LLGKVDYYSDIDGASPKRKRAKRVLLDTRPALTRENLGFPMANYDGTDFPFLDNITDVRHVRASSDAQAGDAAMA